MRSHREAGDLLPMVLGVGALVGGTLLGWDPGVVSAIVSPPPVLRAVLAGVAVIVAVALLRSALERIGSDVAEPRLAQRDLPRMVRGIRFVFLAIAAGAAAAGWILGHPLPIVIALVIAGVDVVETSFLLLVVRTRHPSERSRDGEG